MKKNFLNYNYKAFSIIYFSNIKYRTPLLEVDVSKNSVLVFVMDTLLELSKEKRTFNR